MERETGIGPATNSLEGCDSTTELLPPCTNLWSWRRGLNSRPLPYQGSALPLSYASQTCPYYPTAIYRLRSLPSTTRNPANPNNTNVRSRYFPASIVQYADKASSPITTSATIILPLPDGLKSTSTPYDKTEVNGAQGRIRTSVTRRVADLQSAAINHSATCAHLFAVRPTTTQAPALTTQNTHNSLRGSVARSSHKGTSSTTISVTTAACNRCRLKRKWS